MTLLMIKQFTDEVTIVTDTLVTSADGSVVGLQQKTAILPGTDILLAGTGNFEVLQAWCRAVEDRGASDIGEIDKFAPATLRAIDAQLTALHGPIGPSTVYHFGYLPGTTDLVSYIYSSKANYESRRDHCNRFLLMPQPETFSPFVPEGAEEYVRLAQLLRSEHDEGKAEEFVGIGGQLFCTSLSTEGIAHGAFYEFPDYAATLAALSSGSTL